MLQVAVNKIRTKNNSRPYSPTKVVDLTFAPNTASSDECSSNPSNLPCLDDISPICNYIGVNASLASIREYAHKTVRTRT